MNSYLLTCAALLISFAASARQGEIVAPCQAMLSLEAHESTTAENHLSPGVAAISVKRWTPASLEKVRSARVSVLMPPRYGSLIEASGVDIPTYIYRPNAGFSGYDAAVFEVTLNDRSRMKVTMPVQVGGDVRFPPDHCPVPLTSRLPGRTDAK